MFISAPSLAEVQDQTSQCLKGLKEDARFTSISRHVVLDGQDVAASSMLQDSTTPDDQQKLAIADWIDARSGCVNLSPSKVFVDLHILFLSIVPDLYNGQATFGEFNRKWHELFKEVTEAPAKPQGEPVSHHH